jgi:hypothetical protein
MAANADANKAGLDHDALETARVLGFVSVAVLSLKLGDFDKPTSASDLAKLIRQEAAKKPGILENFGGPEAFEQTLRKVEKLDAKFQSTGGVFFKLGSSAAETAQNFADTQLKWRADGNRPSLVGEVAHYLDEIGLERKDPLYKANLLVALRGEVEAATGAYHNQNHFLDVNAQTIEFLKKNNELAEKGVAGAVKLSPAQLAEGLLSANRHDIGHPGGKNITVDEAATGQKLAADPFRLEQQSVDITEPLLKAAGVSPDAIARSNVAVLTTSPDMNGPAKLLREVDRLHNAGEPVAWEALPDHEKFPQLKPLAEDPQLRVISQNLRAADTGESSLYGLEANTKATQDLDKEWRDYQKYDPTAKLLNPDGETVKPVARWGFLEFVTGGKKGPDAPAVQEAVGENYQNLYTKAVADFEDSKKNNPAKPAPPVAAAERATVAAAPETPAPPPASDRPAAAALRESSTAVKGLGVGMNVFGAWQGLEGTVDSYKRGDKAGVALNATTFGVSGTGLAVDATKALGGAAPEALESTIGKAAPVLVVATAVYDIAKADGPVVEKDGSIGNKGVQIIESGTTATVALGVGIAATAVGTVSLATVAAPVVATVAVAETGKMAHENWRMFKELDKDTAKAFKAARVDRDKQPDAAPSAYNFKNLPAIMGDISRRIPDDKINGKVERTADGRFKNPRQFDLNDPANLAAYEKALNGEIASQKRIMADNDSILPRWIRSGDSAGKYETAKIVLTQLESAKTELAMHKQDLRDYNDKRRDLANAQEAGANPKSPDKPRREAAAAKAQDSGAAADAIPRKPAAASAAPASPTQPQFTKFALALAQDNMVGNSEGAAMAQNARDLQMAELRQPAGGLIVASAQPGPGGIQQMPPGGAPLVYGAGPSDAAGTANPVLPPVERQDAKPRSSASLGAG